MILTEEQMRGLRLKELDLLRAFVGCCEEMGLRYFVVQGTLLGAVRHGGFIPWDDDIDVGLFREDFDRFVHDGQKHLPSSFFVQTCISDPEFPQGFAKVRDSNTTFVETTSRTLKINHGIYIDAVGMRRPHLRCQNGKNGRPASHIHHYTAFHCGFIFKQCPAHHVCSLVMPRTESHLGINRDIESGPFKPFVEGCLYRAFPVHDYRRELFFPQGIPVARRYHRRREIHIELQIQTAQYEFHHLCAVAVLLHISFQERLFHRE